jgi:hypothetical protein
MHKYSPIHNSTCYIVNTLPSKWVAYIFDELCKMSDQGMKLILMPRSIHNGQHIEPITLMKPYEGSQLQIEADLKSPDYAYLDEAKSFVVPF